MRAATEEWRTRGLAQVQQESGLTVIEITEQVADFNAVLGKLHSMLKGIRGDREMALLEEGTAITPMVALRLGSDQSVSDAGTASPKSSQATMKEFTFAAVTLAGAILAPILPPLGIAMLSAGIGGMVPQRTKAVANR
jgi:hypothetical protein